ncbi:hypothetical protein A3K86_13850 [Photobacterium jeanii]|uniref:Major facilitator superfamily (MFS) profile domain-containing protein n=1 Tax=Photobacterium jeanii TaxID=858640 RepID=A0A178KAB6_9GAMM|nr:MdtL family multidrug efflux MFS transporter [Photobacterium jeanii]OAN13654.1 hypothetical protein A3K86_13850 [Photobacterium jeanii]PST88775.1 multidrug transporter MdtL [Photobacterium jeanii]
MSKLILCCFSLVLLYPLGIDLYLVGVPQIASNIAASESDMHNAFSFYLFGLASMMLIAGYVADKVGRKPVAIIGSCIFMLASIMAGQAESVTAFLSARFLQGVGAGFAYVVCFAILRDTLTDQKRAKIMSMINGVICIVPVLAPVLGHFILLFLPWQQLFLGMALLGGAIGLFCLIKLPETKSGQENTSAKVQLNIFLNTFFLSRLLILSLGITSILTYVNTSPLILMQQLGYSTGDFALAMGLLSSVSMLTSFSTPKLLNHFKQNSIIIAGLAVLTLAGTAVYFANMYQLEMAFLLGFLLTCAGFSLCFGTTTSQALSLYPDNAGLASAVLGVCQISLSALYIFVTGIFAVSPSHMLVSILVTSGIIGVCLLNSIKPAQEPVTL